MDEGKAKVDLSSTNQLRYNGDLNRDHLYRNRGKWNGCQRFLVYVLWVTRQISRDRKQYSSWFWGPKIRVHFRIKKTTTTMLKNLSRIVSVRWLKRVNI